MPLTKDTHAIYAARSMQDVKKVELDEVLKYLSSMNISTLINLYPFTAACKRHKYE